MKAVRPYPPEIILRFFQWYCKPNLKDHIEGDLIEVYRKRIQKNGKRNADIRFIIDVLKLIRPGIVRRPEGFKNLHNYSMYQTYFKIGWRNLRKHKGLTTINITGLAIGIATCLIIMLFVVDELSFDRYNEKADRIVRVVLKGKVNGEVIKEAVTPAPVAPTKATFSPCLISNEISRST